MSTSTHTLGNRMEPMGMFVDRNDYRRIDLQRFKAMASGTQVCGYEDFQTGRICLALHTMDRRFNGMVSCSQCGMVRTDVLSNMDFKFDTSKSKLICQSFRNRELVERDFYGDRLFASNTSSLLSSSSLSSSSPAATASLAASFLSSGSSVPPLIKLAVAAQQELDKKTNRKRKADESSGVSNVSASGVATSSSSSSSSTCKEEKRETKAKAKAKAKAKGKRAPPKEPKKKAKTEKKPTKKRKKPASSSPSSSLSLPSPSSSLVSSTLSSSSSSSDVYAPSASGSLGPDPALLPELWIQHTLPPPTNTDPLLVLQAMQNSSSSDSTVLLSPAPASTSSKSLSLPRPKQKKKKKKQATEKPAKPEKSSPTKKPAAKKKKLSNESTSNRLILCKTAIVSKGEAWISKVPAPSPREEWESIQDLDWAALLRDSQTNWCTFANYKMPNDKKRCFNPLECSVVIYITSLMQKVAFLPHEFFSLFDWNFVQKDFDSAWRSVYQMIRKWWYETQKGPLFDVAVLGSRYLDRLLARYDAGLFHAADSPPSLKEREQVRQFARHYMDVLVTDDRYVKTKQAREEKQSKKKPHERKTNSQASRYIIRDWLLVTCLTMQWAFMYDVEDDVPLGTILRYVGLDINKITQDGKAFLDLFRKRKYTHAWVAYKAAVDNKAKRAPEEPKQGPRGPRGPRGSAP
jgi:hypothetical protein